jgi:hypothetical protein
MPRHGFLLWIVLLGVVASTTSACGGPANPQHQILSLAVSPITADAQNYPNGEVPFTATGTYTSPPTTVTPLAATWVVVDQSGGQTTNVSITTNGLAQCVTGAPGVYSVGAWVTLFPGPPKVLCNVATPFGNPCGDSVLGIAQLTCP